MRRIKGEIAHTILISTPMWVWRHLPLRIRVWAFLNDL